MEWLTDGSPAVDNGSGGPDLRRIFALFSAKCRLN
jgi:hypothetical protein